MSMNGEFVREQEVRAFCERMAEKIKEYEKQPEIVKIIKELALETLNNYAKSPEIEILENKPEWIKKYLDLFQ